MVNHRTLRRHLMLAAVALVAVGRRADAADPLKAARKCRGVVASAVGSAGVAGGSASAVGSCEQVGRPAQCDFTSVAPFQQAVARGKSAIGTFCPAGNPIHDNYPQGPDIGAIVFPDVQRRLEGLAFPPLSAADKTKGKCRAAIAKARAGVVKEIVKGALGCQKKLDKHASAFGALDHSCERAPTKSAAKAGKLIAKGCKSLTGADVGACDPLPGCVVDAAAAVALGVAADAFGGASTCGNGIEELGELCDDGNAVDGDGCTNACEPAKCGDGVVETGVEECDEGANNGLAGIVCQDGCKLPVCGNGKVETGEECDDGNQVAGDHCTDCLVDPVACGANGALLTLALDYTGISSLAGMKLDLAYPDRVSIPGTAADQSVMDRVTTLQDAFGSVNDHDANGDAVDDTITNVLVASDLNVGFHSGDIESVSFACSQGTLLPPGQFACTVKDATDSNGFPVPQSIGCTLTIQAQ